MFNKNCIFVQQKCAMKVERPKCGCGNTQNPEGYCDGSHANKS